jgi:hypothetical protein
MNEHDAAFWQQRYQELSETANLMRSALDSAVGEVRRWREAYDELSQKTGEALGRAHMQRGDAEKLARRYREALEQIEYGDHQHGSGWFAEIAAKALSDQA